MSQYQMFIDKSFGVDTSVYVFMTKEVPGYLYMADTLQELLEIVQNEWEDDKHLVG